MSTSSSSIEWTDVTWNPVRGCSRVSPGCEHCYAEGMAARFSGPGLPYEGLARRAGNGEPRWTGAVRLVPEHLADPLSWRKPRRVFVNSMSDLFHERLTNEQIAAVFGVMAAAPRHTFQVLTKRADRMRDWFEWVDKTKVDAGCSAAMLCAEEACNAEFDGPGAARLLGLHPGSGAAWPLPNVWLGVSVEDQQRADERIPELLKTSAAVRFISAEPLLGPVQLSRWMRPMRIAAQRIATRMTAALGSEHVVISNESGLDWVIVGGESGHGARPFDLAWARSIVADCEAANVACFCKQLGADPIDGLAGCSVRLRDRKGGDMAEWPPELRVREFPEVPCAS